MEGKPKMTTSNTHTQMFYHVSPGKSALRYGNVETCRFDPCFFRWIFPPKGTCRNNLFAHQNSLRTCYRCALGQFGGIPCGVQIGWGIKQRELSIIAYYTGKMVIMIMLNSSNSLVHYKNYLGWSG